MQTERLGAVLAPGFRLRAPRLEYPYRLYLIRDEERKLYAGQSKLPVDRIKQHVYGRDCIGAYIADHRPASLSWFVDFMTLLDFGLHVPDTSPSLWGFINQAERRLIKEYQPLCNNERSKRGHV